MNENQSAEKKKALQSRWTRLLCILAFLLLLGSCDFTPPKWEYKPITDINNLEGRRVGVNLAWESDYYLSGRTDMTLYRYDDTAGMILALSNGNVDALALDELSWKTMERLSDGLVISGPAFGTTGYELYFAPDKQELLDSFNQFLAEYKKTDAYKDFLQREADFDGENYIGPDIPMTGTGEVLRVAYLPDSFPRIVFTPGGGAPTGFDLEILKLYANANNHPLEYFPSTYNDVVAGLQNGVYDIAVGFLSDIYNDDVRATGLLVSDTMDETPMYFIQKTKLDISMDLDSYE